jgi:hypothetical protein
MVTLLSSTYTFYKIHPHIPYKLIWVNAIVPLTFLVMQSIKDGIMGQREREPVDPHCIVGKTFYLENPTTTFTYLGVEYEDDGFAEPVWL